MTKQFIQNMHEICENIYFGNLNDAIYIAIKNNYDVYDFIEYDKYVKLHNSYDTQITTFDIDNEIVIARTFENEYKIATLTQFVTQQRYNNELKNLIS